VGLTSSRFDELNEELVKGDMLGLERFRGRLKDRDENEDASSFKSNFNPKPTALGKAL
jgi:hypothetical protein